MDLTSKTEIKKVLTKHQIRPLKNLGQNFLVNKNILNKFIDACDLGKQDIVLEVGPGLGTITRAIASKVQKVIATEKDKNMCLIMKETLVDFKNIEIINTDALKYKINETHYKLVGNLPFHITAPLIRKFLESKKQPQEMIFMIQKEVGQRICAKPPNMSILSISVQLYAKPKIVSHIPKSSFWPQPKVDSVIIKITPLINKLAVNADEFFKILKTGFSSPRKQLVNNLSKGLKKDKQAVAAWLLKNNIQPNQRAETLSVLDWIKLTNRIK